jgi:hypothetical protein
MTEATLQSVSRRLNICLVFDVQLFNGRFVKNSVLLVRERDSSGHEAVPHVETGVIIKLYVCLGIQARARLDAEVDLHMVPRE